MPKYVHKPCFTLMVKLIESWTGCPRKKCFDSDNMVVCNLFNLFIRSCNELIMTEFHFHEVYEHHHCTIIVNDGHAVFKYNISPLPIRRREVALSASIDLFNIEFKLNPIQTGLIWTFCDL